MEMRAMLTLDDYEPTRDLTLKESQRIQFLYEMYAEDMFMPDRFVADLLAPYGLLPKRSLDGLRRAVLLGNAEGHATKTQRQARIDFYGGLCWICRAPYQAVDHVKPIAKGGSKWPANLRPICTPCNSRKGAKWPYVVETA